MKFRVSGFELVRAANSKLGTRNCDAMHRTERIAETLREEIAQIVGFELEDPRLTMVTVTEVRVADDLRDASVYVTVQGDESEHQQALKALEHAAPYVRRQLGFSLNLRHTPVLHFVRDSVEEKAERVDTLLQEIGSEVSRKS